MCLTVSTLSKHSAWRKTAEQVRRLDEPRSQKCLFEAIEASELVVDGRCEVRGRFRGAAGRRQVHLCAAAADRTVGPSWGLGLCKQRPTGGPAERVVVMATTMVPVCSSRLCSIRLQTCQSCHASSVGAQSLAHISNAHLTSKPRHSFHPACHLL